MEFIADGKAEHVPDFKATCSKCKSENVIVEYEFNYYGGATGYDMHLYIKCADCDNEFDGEI